MDAINQRIAQFIDSRNMNPNRFAREAGYKRPDNIYNVYTGRTKPSWEMLEAIANRFPELNMNWLLRGTGEMTQTGSEVPDTNGNESTLAGSRRATGEGAAAGADNEPSVSAIPAVPLAAQADYREGYSDAGFVGQLSRLVLPGFAGENLRAFQMQGDSMEPSVREGDYLICSLLESPAPLKPGQVYLMLTTEGISIGRLAGPAKENRVKLRAESPFYPPHEHPLSQAREIWQVTGLVTAHVPYGSQPPADRLLPVVEALEENTHLTRRLLTALSREHRE